MDLELKKSLSDTLQLDGKTIETVLTLLEDNTVPFIARYRKEQTGNLDETTIRDIAKVYDQQKKLEDRKNDVLRLIEERGMLTDDLKDQILQAKKLVDVEDLYRPFKEKKKTKATEAIKKGLEPLAQWLLKSLEGSPEEEAKKYVNDAVASVEEALQGAKDIIAEMYSDDPKNRKALRFTFEKEARIHCMKKKNAVDEKSVFQDYYDYDAELKTLKPFRVLAINRGEKEKILTVSIKMDEETVLKTMEARLIPPSQSVARPYLVDALKDGYKRLIKPSLEREIRAHLSETAETQAIHVFGENLYQLLLQPPLKTQTILGVDPAFRTGCKVAVVDATGRLLKKDVMYPHQKFIGENVPEERIKKAFGLIESLVKTYQVDTIAIGNGTASRETETFVGDVIKEASLDVSYAIVSEAGASVYSASPLALHEFPDLSVEERSAISIARRLQDPLSELVKIDPKSLGVGQYQHDVTVAKLSDSLNDVVESAVNQVGVNVNTASAPLLMYVAGLSSKMAENIVQMRDEIGTFTSRKALKKVKGIGPKSYEQAIGFLRIFEGKNPLDQTGIHPESYPVTEQLLTHLNLSVKGLGGEAMTQALSRLDIATAAREFDVGVLTLEDIVASLKQPLRDIRDDLPKPLLKKGIIRLEDLKKGDQLQGTIRNIVDFGAFVDCGVKTDGLVHISQLANRYVKHPLDVVKVGQIVDVYVVDVDIKRGRLQLTMLKEDSKKPAF